MIDIINAIIAIAALIISIWSFWSTREMASTQIRAATFASIMDRLFEINRLEVEKPFLFEQLTKDFDAKLASRNRTELINYVFMVFNLYLEIHTQHEKYHLFDAEQMKAWEARITNDLKARKFLRGYWKAEMHNFPDEYTESFKAFMSKLAERAEQK